MKKLGAAFLALSLAWAGGASAATAVNASFSPVVGQITTYTIRFSARFSGSATVYAQGDRTFNWYSPGEGGGTYYTQADPGDAFTVQCVMLGCADSDSLGTGRLKLSLYAQGENLVFRVDNRLFSYDYCDQPVTGTCSYRFEPARLVIAGQAYGPEDFSVSVASTAVPEPSTWAMMILGFGAVGSMVRASRRRKALSAA